MSTIAKATAEKIRDFVQAGIEIDRPDRSFESDPFWQNLARTGTEIWLDTGDMDAALQIWTREMRALTTNNTLLNKEIQKGIYDDFIRKADEIVADLDPKTRVMEIAFILNARHGLRLVETFGGKVSVELHTDLSHDLEGIIHYGTRFHEICPDHFIVKVPLTAAGFLGARKLREKGVPVNFTLGFSARHNVLAAGVAKPNYCNVFLGRLNSFVKEHNLGSGENVGEKATLASQRAVRDVVEDYKEPTRQIAASMRAGEQVETLAGVDVFTMPTKVATEAHGKLDGSFRSRVEEDYPVDLAEGVDPHDLHLEKLWEVSDEVYRLAESLDQDPPENGEAVMQRARAYGCADLFPDLSDADMERIREDGKIPDFTYWKHRIRHQEVALDTLLSISGLESFTADQAALDSRIKQIISG
jgi:transaldolase